MIAERPLRVRLEGAGGERDLSENVMVLLEQPMHDTQAKAERLRMAYISTYCLSLPSSSGYPC